MSDQRNRMRVALDGMLLSHLHSGVERSIQRLVEGLAEHGREDVVVYVPREYPGRVIEGPRLRIRHSRCPGRFRLLRIAWEQTVLPRRVARDGADLLHAPGYLAPLLSRPPVVLTIYDLIALKYPAWCKPSNAFNYRLLLPPSVARAAGIIVPSEKTRSDLMQRFPGLSAEVRIVPLGVGAEFSPRASEDVAAVSRKYRLPPDYALFVGRIEPKKNLIRLVEAFALLKRRGVALRLVIAGRGDWGLAPLKKAIRAAGLQEDVLLTGFVRPEDLPGLYAGARLFVFPSIYEGFGLPPLEAMACGVPVVVSAAGALAEVAGDAAVKIDPASAADLADAMAAVAETPSLRNRCIELGFRNAQRFSWSRTVAATEAFYRDVAAKEPRA